MISTCCPQFGSFNPHSSFEYLKFLIFSSPVIELCMGAASEFSENKRIQHARVQFKICETLCFLCVVMPSICCIQFGSFNPHSSFQYLKFINFSCPVIGLCMGASSEFSENKRIQLASVQFKKFQTLCFWSVDLPSTCCIKFCSFNPHSSFVYLKFLTFSCPVIEFCMGTSSEFSENKRIQHARVQLKICQTLGFWCVDMPSTCCIQFGSFNPHSSFKYLKFLNFSWPVIELC